MKKKEIKGIVSISIVGGLIYFLTNHWQAIVVLLTVLLSALFIAFVVLPRALTFFYKKIKGITFNSRRHISSANHPSSANAFEEFQSIPIEVKETFFQDIDKHLDILLIKRRSGVFKDEYGFEDDSKWQSDFRRFANKVNVNQVEVIELGLTYVNEKYNANNANNANNALPNIVEFRAEMDGIEYEHYCANILNNLGWETHVLKASGDQGVDIIASKENRKYAIQCKRYSKPVGNKAIQEVIAGKIFYNIDSAIVVSNSYFTKSAQQLASATGVILLHHEQLSHLKPE